MSDSDKTRSFSAPSGVVPPQPLSAGRAGGSHFAGDAADEKPPRRFQGLKIALAVVAILLVAAYAAGAWAFSRWTYPATSIAGVDISLMERAEARAALADQIAGYRLAVDGNGFSWEYAPEDPAQVFDADAAVERVFDEQSPLLWPARLIEHLAGGGQGAAADATDLEAAPDRSLLSASFDEAAFTEQLGAAVDAFNEGRSGTFSAATAYDPEAGTFTVEKAREQEKLDRDNIIAYTLNVLAQMGTDADITALGNEAYEPLAGGFTDDQLEAACTQAAEFLGTDVTFKMGEVEAARLDGSVISQWITFDENLVPSIDQATIDQWAQAFAEGLNTVGTERTYTRPDGKQVTVSGGVYGWEVDTAAVTQAVKDAIANKQTGTIDVPCSSTAAAYNGPGGRDWGAWADVDLTEQYARLYDANDNLIWETPIISGNPNTGGATPEGVWAVTNKQRNVTLVSVNKDPETGEPDYRSPVDYWIAFQGNLIGFHDASWQPADYYGKADVYLWAGSHGCINTPYDKVAQLWDLIQVGDCVIVHS